MSAAPEGVPTTTLGSYGPEVSRLAFGAMALSGIYGPTDEAAAVDLVRSAMDRGVSYLDTANSYGDGHNERLIGRAVRGRRDEVVVATKFGIQQEGLGRPAKIREALEASLTRLRTEYVDLYYMHRFDPTTPIEESMGALSDLVAEGKVRHVGLSEVSPDRLRAAHAVHPVAAVQQEFSLLSREPQEGLLEVSRELGVALVAYSPLSRGLLGGAVLKPDDLAADDPRRRRYPRFGETNLGPNLAIVRALAAVADELAVSLPVLAIAWVLAQGDDVVALVGTRSIERLDDDLAALRLDLRPEVLQRLESIAPSGAAHGDRYNPVMAQRLDRA